MSQFDLFVTPDKHWHQKSRRLLYAGTDLETARDIFAKAIKHRPRIRLTIQQGTRVLDQSPRK